MLIGWTGPKTLFYMGLSWSRLVCVRPEDGGTAGIEPTPSKRLYVFLLLRIIRSDFFKYHQKYPQNSSYC